MNEEIEAIQEQHKIEQALNILSFKTSLTKIMKKEYNPPKTAEILIHPALRIEKYSMDVLPDRIRKRITNNSLIYLNVVKAWISAFSGYYGISK